MVGEKLELIGARREKQQLNSMHANSFWGNGGFAPTQLLILLVVWKRAQQYFIM